MAQDSCVVTTPTTPSRPTRYDDVVTAEAAKSIAIAYAKWCDEDFTDDHVVSIAKALKYCWDTDGYKLARELERIDHCDSDEELVDILGRATGDLYDAERQAVAAWVNANGIQIPFDANEPVETPDGVGKIVSIDVVQATLCVAVPKHATSKGYIGTIYAVEKVKAVGGGLA